MFTFWRRHDMTCLQQIADYASLLEDILMIIESLLSIFWLFMSKLNY